MSEQLLSLVPRLSDTVANQSVLGALEEMMVLARSGELVGVFMVGYDKQRQVSGRLVPGENPTLLLGGIHLNAFRLAKFIDA